jgi:hypothetical protein
MNKIVINIAGIALVLLFLSGCLTVEKKEYTFVMKDKNSGTLTIKFVNILSLKDDTTNVSASDFEELIANYIDGNEMEADFENALIRGKRLFEENGVLCGEVVIDFNDLESVGLFRYDEKSPYMFNVSSFLDSESFLKCNGRYGSDAMPVVFWPDNMDILELTTQITTPDETAVSLLTEYNNWK